jgi:hypothetical protein
MVFKMIMFVTYQKHLYLLSKTIVLFENSKKYFIPKQGKYFTGRKRRHNTAEENFPVILPMSL